MSTDAAADVLSDLVQTTTRSTHLHSFCYVPCKRVRDATLLSIFQFFTFAARI